MKNLPQVTLIAVGSEKYRESLQTAIYKSCQGLEYGKEKLIIADLKTIDEYSRYILFDLYKHVQTDFALVIQGDGYVLRPELWSDEFLKYDYIGAPWIPKRSYTKEGKEVRVGNGGFSLRSKKLLRAFIDLNLPFTDNGTGYFNEDGQICVYHRKVLEDYGVKFAPVELAAKFSTELKVPETVLSFGGHRYL